MSERKWYEVPGADDLRPMTVEDAADWLRMRELGFEEPCATLRDWAARGRIAKCKIGNRVVFTLRILRHHVQASTTIVARPLKAKPAPPCAVVPPKNAEPSYASTYRLRLNDP